MVRSSMHLMIAVILLSILIGDLYGQADSLALTEVMFNPRNGSDNEFIELYASGVQPVDLSGWTLADGNQADQIVDAGQGTVLQPGRFAVVFDQDYDLQNGMYLGRIPPDALILRVDDAGIGNGLGNSGDAVFLIDPNADTVAAYAYVDANPQGLSDEKINPNGPDDPPNWSNSLEMDGTPGARNSVSPKTLDLSLSERPMVFSPAFPNTWDDVAVTVWIRNPGLEAASHFCVDLIEDENRDSIFADSEKVDSVHVEETIGRDDSLLLHFTLPMLGAGRHDLQARLDSGSWTDDCPENDFVLGSIRTHSASSFDSLTLSEVMFYPGEGGTKNEYIEIVNFGSGPVDLAGWGLGIILSTDHISDAGFGTLLGPGSRAVIFPGSYDPLDGFYDIPAAALIMILSDEAFELAGLYDDSDTGIHLISPAGDTVSSYRYSADNPRGIPDEKVFPDSEDWLNGTWPGGTPGNINSVTPVNVDLVIEESGFIWDPPYPMVDDSLSYEIEIRNDGMMTATDWLIEVILCRADPLFNTTRVWLPGRADTVILLSRLGPSLGTQETLTISGTHHVQEIDHGATLAAHVYHSADPKAYNNRSERPVRLGAPTKVIVINEIMHSPGAGESEWIEIHNAGTDTADLRDWQLEDPGGSLVITTSTLPLLPGGFLVIADASSFFNLHPNVPAERILLNSGLPTLSGSETITVLDAETRVVDQVAYDESPASRTGVSLERRSPILPSSWLSNWRYSISSAGSTPGAVNSLITAEGFEANAIIVNEIMYDPLNTEPEYVEIFNPGVHAVNLLNWTIETDSDEGIISTEDLWLQPASFLILREDVPLDDRFEPDIVEQVVPESNLPSLVNSGTSIVLRDLTGKLIDSVRFETAWGEPKKGLSLERKSPDNSGNDPSSWASCVLPEGGTPGKRNSVFSTGTVPKNIKLSVTPNPFFPESGQQVTLTYQLPFPVANVTIRVYDHVGRLIRTLLNFSPSGGYREIWWDGTDKKGTRARMGIYIVHLQAVSADGKSHHARTTVVLGIGF